MPHDKKMPRKPAKKDELNDWVISSAARKAIIAMLHHGKYLPAIKLNAAVNKTDNKNLIPKI